MKGSIRCAEILTSTLLFFVSSASSMSYPYDLAVRQVRSLDFGWKYFRGTPQGGMPSDRGYGDDSWATVNVPHSIHNVEPTADNQRNIYRGVVWYRKHFVVPPSFGSRVFVEFEGAMSVAEVWINGALAGTHLGGYTGFTFDVTESITRGSDNVLAVKLDNTPRNDVPPGTTLDYQLFGGLYRDVWLVTTGNVYIPYCGQLISTPSATASSATVRARTTLNNANTSAKSCAVALTLLDSNGVELGRKSLTADVPPQGSKVFDISMDPLSSPRLWSPENPYLYYVATTVQVDGVVTDDQLDRIGVRSCSWSPTAGFSLNGQRYQLIGTCLHQDFAWVENAVPNSRFYKEVELMKDMGMNSVRCSHYPRDPAFYDALDRLGMVALVEAPTWGWGTTSYSTAYWTVLEETSVPEMVLQGHNHPSIIAWGLFNEPDGDFSSHYRNAGANVHGIDALRPTFVAFNYALNPTSASLDAVDICGLNYSNSADSKYTIVNTEYHLDQVDRGDPYETNFANNRWSTWQGIVAAGPRLAGGHLWCFADYKANWLGNGMVDIYRVPKKAFYLFRENLTGKPADNPQAGTATRVRLDADLLTLRADSCDISLLIASLRDNANACINAGEDITFSITGPASIFGSAVKRTIAGKVAAVLQSKNTPGTVRVIASAAGLVSDTVVLTVVEADTSVARVIPAVETLRFSADQGGPAPAAQSVTINLRGAPANPQVTVSNDGPWLTTQLQGLSVTNSVDPSGLPSGNHYATVQVSATEMASGSYAVLLRVNGPPHAASLVVTPSSCYVLPGTTRQLEAATYDQFGEPFDATVTWSVSQGGAISSGGLFTSDGSEGTFQVIASVGDVSDSVEVTVAPLQPGLHYEYYESSVTTVDQIADFTTAISSGQVSNFSIASRTRNEDFAFRFTGFIRVPADGQYTFATNSDDGSALFIDGQRVVDNDGTHAPQQRTGSITLAAGDHAVEVLYYQGNGGLELSVEWQVPGGQMSAIPDNVLFHFPDMATVAAEPTALSRPPVEVAAARGIMHIRVNCPGTHAVWVLDARGRLVRSMKGTDSANYSLDRKYLGSGVHFVRISTVGQVDVRRLVVE